MTQVEVALEEVGRFTDHQLIARLRDLVRADQALGARLLVHLGEVDARGLYRDQAYSSMFAYCVEELHMSEAEAYLRIHAARLGRQFPLVVQLVERGSLHLSAIKRLGPHLTVDNHLQVLERASGKGKREIELLVAELAPKPDVPNRMRKLPEKSSAPASRTRVPVALPLAAHAAPSVLNASIAAPSLLENQMPFALERIIAAPTVGASATSFTAAAPRPHASSPLAACPAPAILDASSAVPPSVTRFIPASTVVASEASEAASERVIAAPKVGAREASFALEAPRPRASFVPLSPGRHKLTLTAGQGMRNKLEQLQALLRHRVPDGDLAVIVELAVDLLFDKTMKQRFAQTKAPKTPRSMQRDDAQTQAPRKPRSVQRDDAQTQAPRKPRSVRRDDAQSQTPKQHRAIQRGDEHVRATSQLQPLAVNASVAAMSRSGLLETQDRDSSGSRSRQINSRYNPRAVVREVYARDGGRCTFVSSSGKRCSERGFLELHHHDVTYGRGGKATVDNLRLACRAHNALFAERDYGSRFMRFKQWRGAHEHAD